MCDTPVKIKIRSFGFSTSYPFLVRCGTCATCQNQNRSEFVMRCKSERDHCKSSFFLTLTYSDNNLIYSSPDMRRSAYSELKRISKLPPEQPFKYDSFILSQRHGSEWLESMQKQIKNYNQNLLFRVAIAGEYGTFSHRPHMHALVFSPLYFDMHDFYNAFRYLWRYGNYYVEDCDDGAINYVAKHFVKEDVGCKYQQQVAPNFLLRSVYHGGLGRDLFDDAMINLNMQLGNYVTHTGKFKLSIPRFLQRRFRHDIPFSESEIAELSRRNADNFAKRFVESGFGVCRKRVVDGRVYIDDSDLERFRQYYGAISFNKKLTYKKQKFVKKMLSLRSKGYFDTENEKNV